MRSVSAASSGSRSSWSSRSARPGSSTALDHSPGSSGRTDLTAQGDAEVTPLLDDAEAGFAALADQVERSAIQARGALAALNGADPASPRAAIATGDELGRRSSTPDRALRGVARRRAVCRHAGGRAAG